MNRILRALVVGVVSVTLLVPAAQADAAACVSKGEFRAVHVGMSMSKVRQIFGTKGHRTPVHGIVAIRRYNACPQNSFVRVAYRNRHMTFKKAIWNVH